MRLWMTNPKALCRAHLLGEHREVHTFTESIKRKISMDGYIELGLLDPSKLQTRHTELVEEMTRRGYGHYSPFEEVDTSYIKGTPYIDPQANLKELASRCEECRRLQNDS